MTPEEKVAKAEMQLNRARARLAQEQAQEAIDEIEDVLRTQPRAAVCPRCASDLIVTGDNKSCPDCHWVPRPPRDEALSPDLQALTLEVHAANAKWWMDLETGQRLNRNVGEMLMLVVSELSEALEGHRKNLRDDKLPDRRMFEVELADAVIRCLDIMGGLELRIRGIDIHFFEVKPNVGETLLSIASIVTLGYSEYVYDPDLQGLGIRLEQTILAIEHVCETMQLDLWGAYREKMAYNAVRVDHTIAARKLADGKKY